MSSADAGGAGTHARRTGWLGPVAAVVRAATAQPGLLVAAVAAVFRLARPGWWRRWPPLPVPSASLWRFRMETAYGGEGDAVPPGDDVVSFLRWSRDMRRWRRR